MATSDSPLSVPDVTLSVARAAGGGSGSPAISSVSGTFTGGQTITVSGSGFGIKATPAPAIYEDWSGATNGQLVSAFDPDWTAYAGGVEGALITNTDSVEGGVCAQNTTLRDGFDTNHKSITPTDTMFASAFMKIKGAREAVSSYAIIKHHRVTSSTSAGGGGVYNGAGVHCLSSQNPSTTGGGSGAQVFITPDDGPSMSKAELGDVNLYVNVPYDVWVRIDYSVVLSTPGEANGYFQVESVSNETETYTNIINRSTGFSHQMDTLIMGLMHANHTGGDFELLQDLIYVDNTFARVEIGNNTDYKLCTYRRLLPPTAWASDQIQATVPHTVPSGNYYVFVTTGDRTQSTGYEVVI